MYNEKHVPTHRARAIQPILAIFLGLFVAPAILAPAPALAAPSDASAPDSGAPVRDPFLAPAPIPLPDTGMPAEESMEAVRLSTQGRFTDPSPRVGDSLDYVVEVEWEDTQVPVIVLAPDSVDFPGFKVIGQATVHKKITTGGSVRNHTEFVFRLRAQTQGTGKAASMKLRYLTGLSRAEEAVFIPTALADIRPAPVRLLDMLWIKALLLVLILGAAGGLGFISFKFASRKRAEKAPKREDLAPAVAALKSRMRSAQNSPDASKEILLEMERLATRFLRDEIEAAGISSPATKFEPLLATYLATPAAQGAGGTAQEWARLGELFKHARFAGGYKEPHELQDAFRTFRKCLKITGEDQHE